VTPLRSKKRSSITVVNSVTRAPHSRCGTCAKRAARTLSAVLHRGGRDAAALPLPGESSNGKPMTASEAGLVRAAESGAERSLRELVKRRLPSDDLRAAASLCLALDGTAVEGR
jgi:hypothetical protein